MGEVRYRSDKWDGLDTFYVQEFDSGVATNGGVVTVGDPLTIDR